MNRITAHEAAEILGISIDYLHQEMRRGNLDIGVAIPPKKKSGNYRYLIYRDRVEKLIKGN